MKNVIKIFGFTILVSAFYAYVALQVPQKETYPFPGLKTGGRQAANNP